MDAPSDKDKELLSAIDQLLNDAHTEIEVFRRQPKRFNVFDIVGVEHYETTHSSILAGILAYGGDNYAPLRSFLKICGQSINLDNKKLEKVSVSTETTIQVNDETRRLDILIEIGQELCIVIENKIYTADHTDQLKAYSTWLNTKTHANKLLIYLTLNGDVSTDGFMGIYTRLSYRKNIRDFLTTCSALPNVDLRFNTTVLQYNEFWENWFMQDDVLNNDIQKRILASKENFEAAQAVFNAFHNAKVKKIQELLGEWQNTNSTNYPVVEGADKLQGKSYNHVLFKWNDDYSFGFEFGAAFFCDLYYGIANTKEDTQNVTPNIPGWLHTSWWPASKYVNDEKIKNLGQNVDLYFTDDGKQTLFDALDNAFQETEALLKRSDSPFGPKS